jgi:hypothetical protein
MSTSGVSAISCTSPKFCVAVAPAGGFFANAVVARWNGSKWSPMAMDPKSTIAPVDVSCASTAFCAAVADPVGCGSELQVWNGIRWWLQPIPLPSNTSCFNLWAVSCPSASSCVAVGQYENAKGCLGLGPCPERPLTIRWNGHLWSRQVPPPNADRVLGGNLSLSDVSCASPSSCLAVANLAAEYWNGARWRLVYLPLPRGIPGAGAATVSCPRPRRCMVMLGYGSELGKSIAEQWNGQRWKVEPLPLPVGAHNAAVGELSCWAPNGCMAVGEADFNTDPQPWFSLRYS